MRTPIVLAILLAGAAVPAAAQDVPRQLTLEDAIRIALQRNPAHRRVLNDEDVTVVGERAAWSQFLPNVSASFSTMMSRSRFVSGEDDFGRPIPEDVHRSRADQSISANVTLYDGLSRVNSLRAARAESRAVAARISGSQNALAADVSRLFYAALHARQRIALEEQLLAPARERLETTEQQLRVARPHPEDVLGAQVDVARQELALEQAHGNARKADLDLRQALGVEEAIAFDLAGGLPALFDPTSLDEDALVARALEAAPRLLELES